MDEYNRGIDPELRQYFKKILKSLIYLVVWFFLMAIVGLYLGWGLFHGAIRWFNVVFYIIMLASLAWVLYRLYRLWVLKR